MKFTKQEQEAIDLFKSGSDLRKVSTLVSMALMEGNEVTSAPHRRKLIEVSLALFLNETMLDFAQVIPPDHRDPEIYKAYVLATLGEASRRRRHSRAEFAQACERFLSWGGGTLQ